MNPTDHQLLQSWSAHRDQPAFTTLAHRYAPLVHAAARRQCPSRADDITQAAFLILSQKSHTLPPNIILASWLLKVTRYLSLTAQREKARRAARERESFLSKGSPMPSNNPSQQQAWLDSRPLLDEALARLNEKDRAAIILHYLQEQTYAQISTQLHIHEAAAKKRVHRALHRLRSHLVGKGIPLTTTATESILKQSHQEPTPASAITAALAAATFHPAHPSTILAKGALKMIWITKAQTPAAITAALLLTLGTGTALLTHFASAQISIPATNPSPVSSPQTTTAPDILSSTNYAFWKNFKPDTSIIMHNDVETGSRHITFDITSRLEDLTPDAATISQKSTRPVNNPHLFKPIQEFQRNEKPTSFPIVGTETLTMNNQKIPCTIIQFDTPTHDKLWLSPQVPGGIVKMEATSADGAEHLHALLTQIDSAP